MAVRVKIWRQFAVRYQSHISFALSHNLTSELWSDLRVNDDDGDHDGDADVSDGDDRKDGGCGDDDDDDDDVSMDD